MATKQNWLDPDFRRRVLESRAKFFGTWEERFQRKIQHTEGCWLWIGTIHKDTGYGVFQKDGQQELAHRLSWIIVNGPIPAGLFVCHHCDTPRCINPDHLFLGTRSENMKDAYHKGRVLIGPEEKLSPEDVMNIRIMLASGRFSHRAISVVFGVCRGTITDIHCHRSWNREGL